MAIDISTLSDISAISSIGNAISGSTAHKITENKGNITSFAALLESAEGMIKETEGYQNAAKEAELSYMLGLNDNLSDLLVAQTKANVSLQYTVAVKNAVVEAYKEIMNLQF